ncbi:hypothetical protein TGS27_1130 [Geobacillus stearothermophilus]|nr:hypothetical protein TGS27_1130 [Geobacillus stearothermophilus]
MKRSDISFNPIEPHVDGIELLVKQFGHHLHEFGLAHRFTSFSPLYHCLGQRDSIEKEIFSLISTTAKLNTKPQNLLFTARNQNKNRFLSMF